MNLTKELFSIHRKPHESASSPWTIEQVVFVLESRRFGQHFNVLARMLGCEPNPVDQMLKRKFGSRVLVDDDADNSHDSPKGIVKLPAIDDIVIPQYSNQIFTMNICGRRVRNGQPELTQARWKCIRSVRGMNLPLIKLSLW